MDSKYTHFQVRKFVSTPSAWQKTEKNMPLHIYLWTREYMEKEKEEDEDDEIGEKDDEEERR